MIPGIVQYTETEKERIRDLGRVRNKNYYNRNKGRSDSGNKRIKEAVLKKATKEQWKITVDKAVEKVIRMAKSRSKILQSRYKEWQMSVDEAVLAIHLIRSNKTLEYPLMKVA